MGVGVYANARRVWVGGSAEESAGLEPYRLTTIVVSIPSKNVGQRRCNFCDAGLDQLAIKKEIDQIGHQ